MSLKKQIPLLACRQGVSIIEFAIIAPVLLLFLIGFMELSLMLFTYAILEGATNVGSRIGKTGYTESGITREQYIRSEVERLSAGFLDHNKLNVSILAYDSFGNVGRPESYFDANGNGQYDENETFIDSNGNGKWDADRGASSAGGGQDVVLYRVSYPWDVFTPLMRGILGDKSGTVTISSIATVRNEKF